MKTFKIKFTAIALLSLFMSLSVAPRVASPVEGGYASLTSVAQGEVINLHVSNRTPKYDLDIYREGNTRELVMKIPGLTGTEYDCPEPGYEVGCGWPVAYRLEIPVTWRSGVYTGEFATGSNSNDKKYILFVVREDILGSTSNILVVFPTNTYNAYNIFGGKSLYKGSLSGSADRVSYDRPYHRGKGRGDFQSRGRFFVDWAERNGYTLEYATDVDFHSDPLLLDNYSVFIGLAHHEYWSREMRDNLDGFVFRGGNAMLLSGNTSFRQVRFSADLRTMICYKNRPKTDPYYLDSDSSNDHLITTEWFKPPVNYPENSTTGLGWRHGGFHNRKGGSSFQYEDGFGGYKVYRTDNWIFANTGLSDGEMIGRKSPRYAILAYEVDGTLLEARDAQGNLAWDRKRYYPLKGALPYVVQNNVTKTPSNFLVLGLAPSTRGHAVMGYFEVPDGGTVFNAGTTHWFQGLQDDVDVQKITANIINKFSSGSARSELSDWSKAGSLKFSALNYSVSEDGGGMKIIVSRTDGSQGTVTVDYATSNDTAIAGADYEATVGTLTWDDGDTSEKGFKITIFDDVATEVDEAIKLSLSNATGGAIVTGQDKAVVVIEDNDKAGFHQIIPVNKKQSRKVAADAVHDPENEGYGSE